MWCLILSFFVFAQNTTPGAQPPQVGAPLPNQGYQPGIPSQAAPSNSPTYQIDPSAQDQVLARLRDKVYRLDGNYAKTLRLRMERKNILLQGSVATEKEKERVFQTVKEQAPAGYSVLNQILVR
jgi:hypothetical protein